MQPFPHHYRVQASAQATGNVQLGAQGIEPLQTQAPPEFGGVPGYWSPETLLTAAVADCFILTFRSVARAARLEWHSLSVDVEGVLERVDGVTRFTRFRVAPLLTLDDDAGDLADQARNALEKAEKLCLVTNSLNAHCELVPLVEARGIFQDAALG